MKPGIILIIGLLALAFVAPAVADRVDVMDKTVSQGETGYAMPLSVRFEKAVESDTSDAFSPVNFPPDKYKFVTLYYTLINPSNNSVHYEFNISIRDRAGRYFTTDPAIDNVPAGQQYHRAMYFAVYRNSTDMQLVWYDKDPSPPWNYYYTYIPLEFTDITPTPSVPPATAPSSSPAPTQSTPGCLPYLPLGLLVGSIGGLGLIARRRGQGR